MKIQPTNFNNHNYNQQISHKATFPVVHWVAEVNGSYAPIAQKEVVEYFQAKLIGFLKANLKKTYSDIQKLEANKNLKKTTQKEKTEIERKIKSLYEILDVPAQRLRGYLATIDSDYRINPTARSYYNIVHGSIDNPYSTTYILTGHNVKDFENKFCKEYGKERSLKKKRIESGMKEEDANTPQYKKALNNYNYGGFDYVNFYPRRIKDKKNQTYTLHTKFEIERNEEGKFIGYRFLDARFLPERGPESPFAKLGIKY